MSYIELMNEKAKITAARAELDEQEKKLDEKIKLASHSYAQDLLKQVCALGEQIQKLGFSVMAADLNDWIDFGTLYLDDEKGD